MAVEILKAIDSRYNGDFKINTADAYRGCAVYKEGVNSSGDFVVNIPTTSAESKMCCGIITKYPLVETGGDTAAATDSPSLGDRVVVLEGPCEIVVFGGAVQATSFSTEYVLGDNWPTAVPSVGSAVWRNAYIDCQTNGSEGRWVATSAQEITGFGVAERVVSTAANYWGPRAKILKLSGSTSEGCYVRLDIDWARLDQPDVLL